MISVIDINPNHQSHSGPPPQRRRCSMLSLNWALKLLIRVFTSCHTAMSFGGWKTNDVHMLGFLKISQNDPSSNSRTVGMSTRGFVNIFLWESCLSTKNPKVQDRTTALLAGSEAELVIGSLDQHPFVPIKFQTQ